MLLELPIMLLSIIPKTSLLCLKLILSDNVKFNNILYEEDSCWYFCTHYHQIYIYIMTPTMYFVEFITFNHCIHHIPNLIKNYCRFTQNFSSYFQNSCLCGMPCTDSLPIMLALCSMLFPSYNAPNYASIIGSSLHRSSVGCARLDTSLLLKIGFVKPNNLMINLAVRLTDVNLQ